MRKPVLSYANNKGADQPVHPRSLISTFVVHCLDSIIPLVPISEISSLYLAPKAEQAGLSLTWLRTPVFSWWDSNLFVTSSKLHSSSLLDETLTSRIHDLVVSGTLNPKPHSLHSPRWKYGQAITIKHYFLVGCLALTHSQAHSQTMSFFVLFWGFMVQSTLLLSCRAGQLTYPHCSWAG